MVIILLYYSVHRIHPNTKTDKSFNQARVTGAAPLAGTHAGWLRKTLADKIIISPNVS
jgi:hypothetical protein